MYVIWACSGKYKVTKPTSNTCHVEWPRKSGKMIEIPEIDKLKWFDFSAAKTKLAQSQCAFVERLEKILP
jgi:predicted NUDIX family NTP pyrophosphohydrolase